MSGSTVIDADLPGLHVEDTKATKGRTRFRDQPKECYLRGPMEAGKLSQWAWNDGWIYCNWIETKVDVIWIQNGVFGMFMFVDVFFHQDTCREIWFATHFLGLGLKPPTASH